MKYIRGYDRHKENTPKTLMSYFFCYLDKYLDIVSKLDWEKPVRCPVKGGYRTVVLTGGNMLVMGIVCHLYRLISCCNNSSLALTRFGLGM